MKRAAREWVKKAEGDHRAARLLAPARGHVYDQVSFLCQQLAEKYLKALLEESGQVIVKTHDLEKLWKMLVPHYPSLRPLRRGMGFLTEFAVTTRYPGDTTTKRQAAAALRWAGRVRDECRKLLGIKSGPGKKKRP